ncbi:MAG: hypothetical protein AAF802_01355 [Planctomycetota bacterium]
MSQRVDDQRLIAAEVVPVLVLGPDDVLGVGVVDDRRVGVLNSVILRFALVQGLDNASKKPDPNGTVEPELARRLILA